MHLLEEDCFVSWGMCFKEAYEEESLSSPVSCQLGLELDR